MEQRGSWRLTIRKKANLRFPLSRAQHGLYQAHQAKMRTRYFPAKRGCDAPPRRHSASLSLRQLRGLFTFIGLSQTRASHLTEELLVLEEVMFASALPFLHYLIVPLTKTVPNGGCYIPLRPNFWPTSKKTPSPRRALLDWAETIPLRQGPLAPKFAIDCKNMLQIQIRYKISLSLRTWLRDSCGLRTRRAAEEAPWKSSEEDIRVDGL